MIKKQRRWFKVVFDNATIPQNTKCLSYQQIAHENYCVMLEYELNKTQREIELAINKKRGDEKK